MTGCAKRSERMFDDAHSTGLWFDHWIALAMVMKLHEMHGIKRACWSAGLAGLGWQRACTQKLSVDWRWRKEEQKKREATNAHQLKMQKAYTK